MGEMTVDEKNLKLCLKFVNMLADSVEESKLESSKQLAYSIRKFDSKAVHDMLLNEMGE